MNLGKFLMEAALRKEAGFSAKTIEAIGRGMRLKQKAVLRNLTEAGRANRGKSLGELANIHASNTDKYLGTQERIWASGANNLAEASAEHKALWSARYRPLSDSREALEDVMSAPFSRESRVKSVNLNQLK